MLDLPAINSALVTLFETAGFVCYPINGQMSTPSVQVGLPELIDFDSSRYACTVEIPLTVIVSSASVEDAQRQLSALVSVGATTKSVVDVIRENANHAPINNGVPVWRAIRVDRCDKFGAYNLGAAEGIGCVITLEILS